MSRKRARNLEQRTERWWAKKVRESEQVVRMNPAKHELRDPIARELETMRKVHEAGNPFGLIDAVIYCDELRLTLPRWAMKALADEMRAQLRDEKLERRMGRHASNLEQHKQKHVDYFRYEAVEDAVKHRAELKKLRGGDKFYLARRLCHGTLAGASASAMKRSWNTVKSALKKNPYEYYLSRYAHYFVPDFSRSREAWERATKSSTFW